jgi:tetratricopeptide (TPR) repeat protein
MEKPELEFSFKISNLPDGEPMTAGEIERILLEQLDRGEIPEKKVLNNLHSLYAQSQMHEKTMAVLERLFEMVEDDEERARYLLYLGQLMERMNDFPMAENFYRDAIILKPQDPAVWYFINNNLGFCLNKLGQHEDAERFLHTAIETDPSRSNAYKNLGLCFQGRGLFDNAAQCFIMATQVNAADPRSLRHLEILAREHPDLSSLIPEFDETLKKCREAVQIAKANQPDLISCWNQRRRQKDEERKEAKKPWWKFWNRK